MIGVIVGNLTRDPEYHQGATPYVKFTVAENYKEKGEKKTNFWDCTAWDGTAEIIAKYAKKGSMVTVSGVVNRVKKDDKWFLNISIDRFQFIPGAGPKREQNDARSSGEYPDEIPEFGKEPGAVF